MIDNSRRREPEHAQSLISTTASLIAGLVIVACGGESTELVDANPPMDAAPAMDTQPPLPDAAVPVELIINGDLEQPDPNEVSQPKNWWTWNSGQAVVFDFEWSPDEALSGSHSIAITGPISPNTVDLGTWGSYLEPERFSPAFGKEIELSVSIKLVGVTGNGVSIVIRGDDDDPDASSGDSFVSTQNQFSITGTADWSRYSVVLPKLKTSTELLLVYLVLLPNTSGTVYFDDVSLTYIP